MTKLPTVAFGNCIIGATRSVEAVGEAPAVVEKKNWMKDVKIKRKGICTGKKYGSQTCPPGSRQYALATTFRKSAKKGGKSKD